MVNSSSISKPNNKFAKKFKRKLELGRLVAEVGSCFPVLILNTKISYLNYETYQPSQYKILFY